MLQENGRKSKKINCPNCQVQMKEVRTDSHYGAIVALEQCPECGGIWFDEFEMYQVKQGKAVEIEKKLDEAKLREQVLIRAGAMLCPKDNTELRLFQDINFPKSIIVESCPQCGGFWFNAGEFARFQNERAKRLKKIAEKSADAELTEIKALLDVRSASGKYDPVNAIGRLGEFLSQPVYGAALSGMTTDPLLASERMGRKAQSEELLNIIWTIISILLRILAFRR